LPNPPHLSGRIVTGRVAETALLGVPTRSNLTITTVDPRPVQHKTKSCSERAELLHRYTSIGRRDAIEPAWDAIVGVVDVIHPIELEDIGRARRLVVAASDLSARDAVHLAVMQRRGINRILTFDTGFDAIIGVERIRP
jgi:uncharacterized protein